MRHKESGFHHDLKELEKVDLSAYTIKPCRYQRLRLHEFFSSMKNNVEIELVKYCLDIILKNSEVTGQLQRFNVIIPDQLMPRNTTVSKVASIIAKQFLTSTIKESHERKRSSVKYAIRVVKEVKSSEGDHNVLSSAVNCCGKFASKFLKELGNNSEEDLLKLNKKSFDSIHGTKSSNKIAEFVFRHKNTRAVPGEKSESIRYGVPRQKHISLRPRDNIAKDFKKERLECEFSLSVIKREFPPNTVTATTRDHKRNTCLRHANSRSVVKAICEGHSCRELCSQVM